MLSDTILMKAVSSLILRSEKQQDQRKVIDTFVDPGILAQILNNNNQVVYGRRGTGKTHVFQVLAKTFSDTPTNAVVFVDARTLGSTSQVCDTSIPLQQRCTALFRDVLSYIHNCLLDHIVNEPTDKAEQAIDALSTLCEISIKAIPRVTEQFISGKERGSTKEGASASGSVSLPIGAGISAEIGSSASSETEKGVSYRVALEDKVIFPALGSSLNTVLGKGNINLIVIFDEWSSLPPEIQPYLAEFFKKSFLPNPRVVLKIASLEYRSRFRISKNNVSIGFEMGSDISSNIDLDDYYVFDRNPNQITSIMANILFKHIIIELPENYLQDKYGITSGDILASRMFTQRPTFQELVRASEGVIRDLFNIFVTAYFDSQRRDRDNIELKSIEQAARQWFENDKEGNLDDRLRKILARIASEVIGLHRARSFLIERDLEQHQIIQQLSDLRIIHLIKRGYADKDNPGRRYNIYTLDYGTYVDLKNTSKQPDLDLFPDTDRAELSQRVVPFDDKRSIRRIILSKEILDRD